MYIAIASSPGRTISGCTICSLVGVLGVVVVIPSVWNTPRKTRSEGSEKHTLSACPMENQVINVYLVIFQSLDAHLKILQFIIVVDNQVLQRDHVPCLLVINNS